MHQEMAILALAKRKNQLNIKSTINQILNTRISITKMSLT